MLSTQECLSASDMNAVGKKRYSQNKAMAILFHTVPRRLSEFYLELDFTFISTLVSVMVLVIYLYPCSFHTENQEDQRYILPDQVSLLLS